jgi:DNA-binding CsgD family transcriptional regulator
VRLVLRPRDIEALDAAGAALLDVDAPSAATADRLVTALGPVVGIESAWGVEAPAVGTGVAGAVPAPFADAGSADLAAAVRGLAELLPAEVRLRERAAAGAAMRLIGGTPRLAWHLEEFPARLGAPAYATFRRTALYAELFGPARAPSASGYVSTEPGTSASLVLSRRTPERGDRRGAGRRARTQALVAVLAPAVHARHALRARLARAGVAESAALGAHVDGLADPALLVAPDGREAHRNAALRALLARPGLDGAALLHALRESAAAALAAGRAAAGERPRSAGRGPLGAAPVVAHAALVPWGAAGFGAVVMLDAPAPGAPGGPALGTPGGARRPGAAAGALTAREREVAALLAERRTNAEIAGALAVSVHTVRRHVEGVLRKLDVRSRFEVRERLAGRGS